MIDIFSVVTFLVLASTIVSAVPLIRRGPLLIPASELWIVRSPNPTSVPLPPSTSNAQISLADGSNEIDTIVSFDLSAYSLSSTSTCKFVIQNIPVPIGSRIVELFKLTGEVTSTTAYVPYINQYEGRYDASTNPSTPVNTQTVPCSTIMQFIIRPTNIYDFISWAQSDTEGAFISFTA